MTAADGRPASPERRRLLRTAGAAGIAAVAGGGLVARGNALHVHRVAPAPGDVTPGGGEPLRVAVLTDVHAPHYWVDFADVAEASRAFDPHLLLVVGDALNRRGDEPLVRCYADVGARLGKFAVLGNWEYQGRCDVAALRREYERAGVRLLVNETATLDHAGERVRLVGLDDFLRGRPALGLLARSADTGLFGRTLVLAHCPVLFDAATAATRAPLLVFSGHTHGGQIAPFGRALLTPPGSGSYVKGWYGATHQRLFVSRGLGNSDIPFRIGSPPELALITL